MKQKNVDLQTIMKQNNFTKNDIIQKCDITEIEFEEWLNGKEPSLTAFIKLYNIIEKTKRNKRKKNIFNGTNTNILIKYDKRKIPERIKYYEEDEIKNNECPQCEFPLQEDTQNMADFYGYDQTRLKEKKYCDSCKKVIIIYKRKGEDENASKTT